MSIINEALKKASLIKNNAKKETNNFTCSPEQESVNLAAETVSHDACPLPLKSFFQKNFRLIISGIILSILSPIVVILIIGSTRQTKPEKQTDIQSEKISVITPDANSTLPDRSPEPFQGASSSELQLAGIVTGQGSPMAIINDSVCMSGDVIGGWEVVKIDNATVLLEKDGVRTELKVQ